LTHAVDHAGVARVCAADRGGARGSSGRNRGSRNVRIAADRTFVDPPGATDRQARSPKFQHAGWIDHQGSGVFTICPGLMIAALQSSVDPWLAVWPVATPDGWPPSNPTKGAYHQYARTLTIYPPCTLEPWAWACWSITPDGSTNVPSAAIRICRGPWFRHFDLRLPP
jgi:hypothetical protein